MSIYTCGNVLSSAAVMHCVGKDYQDKFNPRIFLKRYVVVRDSQAGHMLRCFHDAFQTVPDNVKVLDYGAGPSLIPSIAAASKASEILLAEYAESNCKVLREWLDGDPAAYDWTPHFNYVVRDLEGKGGEAVALRQEKVRNIAKAVVHCDLTQDPIIDSSYNTLYDVVVSSLVVDTIAETYEQYVESMSCLGKLVKPGGSLFLYSIIDNDSQLYTVGDSVFDSFRVDADCVRNAVETAGFGELKSIGDTFVNHDEHDHRFFFLSGIKL